MATKNSHTKHILLVEDNLFDIELTLDAFREAALEGEVFTVRNGKDALDYLFGRNHYNDRQLYPLPSLILLDLKMPGIDGHEVLHIIKTSANLKRLPVIILTSSQEESDLIRCYDNGANSYLVKPVSANGFLQVVNRINQYWLALNIVPPYFQSGDP